MEILESFKKYLEENYDTVGERNTIEAYLRDVKQFIKYFKEKLSIFQELTIQNLKFILKMIKVLNLVQLIEKQQHYQFMKIF